MKASRLLISTLTAAGIVGLAGLAVAQTSTTTAPGATTTTAPSTTTTTTVTPPSITTTTETDAQRMNRERMERDRTNAPAGSGGITNATSRDAPMGSAERRDSSGALIARADRN